MHETPDFLSNLSLVLGVAAITTVICQRLGLPVVLGYILAGLVIGPHVPLALVADREIVETLSELGVILLMFSLGLEFRLRKLFRVGGTAGLIAIIEISLMIWLGTVTGRIFGWSRHDSLFAGAIIAISSTTIIAKAFAEYKIQGAARELVFGILIVEDLVAVLLLAALTTIATGGGASTAALALAALQLTGFLIGVLVVGMLAIPRMIRMVVRLDRPETTVVASIGICFTMALVAKLFGYSVALGAFIAGALIAESGKEKAIEPLVVPVRDMFSAIFFVAVGMLIDPILVMRHASSIVVLTVVVMLGKVGSVGLATFLAGKGTRVAVETGMSMAQIGEFSFIIAALGRELGVVSEFLYPTAVIVSVLTTLFTPWLIKSSGAFANYVDRKLPGPLQTFCTLYGSWLDSLQAATNRETLISQVRRLVLLLLVDAALLCAIVISASVSREKIATMVSHVVGLNPTLAMMLVLAAAAAITIPFCIGIIHLALQLGKVVAEAALPTPGKRFGEIVAVPRRVLVLAVQVGTVIIVGTPVVAVTQPFLPPFHGAIVLLLVLLALGAAFWRSTRTLDGHVRTGAQMLAELVANNAGNRTQIIDRRRPPRLSVVIPGLGDPITVNIDPGSAGDGKTLAELNLRGRTGATVLVVSRGEETIMMPTARHELRAGDAVTLTGAREAIDGAKTLLGSHDGG